MLESFDMINLGLFVEIERIKKPQKNAFDAGKMLCQLVCIFRDKAPKVDLSQWSNIQSFVNSNVNKLT